MPTKIMKFQSPIPETLVRVSKPTGSMCYPTPKMSCSWVVYFLSYIKFFYIGYHVGYQQKTHMIG